MISMILRQRATLAVALAVLAVAGCGEDSLPAPPSPTVPRVLVAPSPPSSALQAPSPTEVRSESRGTVAAAPVPESAAREAPAPSEEGAGSEPLPNGGRTNSETRPRDVQLIYRIQNFTADTVDHQSIRVRWSVETEELSHDRNPGLSLRRRRAPSGAWVSLPASGLNGSTLDTGLQPGTKYTYALDTDDDSAVASATTDPLDDPDCDPLPLRVTATASSASAIRVMWHFTSPPDAECDFTYKVERKTTGSYTTIVASQEEQRHSDSGLSARTRYTYRITARSDDGARSGIAWATTPCPAPSGLVLSARATSRSRIYLSWRNNSLPSGCGPSYKIERKRGLGGYVTIVESQTDNTHSDTGLSSGTTYWYRVTASNDGGSDSDTEAETTHRPTPSPNPPPPPEPEVSRPTGLTARAVSPSEVEVSWTAVSGADRYDTQMMDSGGSWSAAVDAGTGTSHSYTGLTAETEYHFRVRTVDGSRTSD